MILGDKDSTVSRWQRELREADQGTDAAGPRS